MPISQFVSLRPLTIADLIMISMGLAGLYIGYLQLLAAVQLLAAG